jgi:hypothetical protein
MRILRRPTLFAAALTAAAIALAAPALHAIERRPLPAFTLTAADGSAVASTQLVTNAHWLIVYVAPDCAACDGLLASLKTWQSANLVDRTVVIVGADAMSAQTYMQKSLPAEVGGIRWFADEGRQAWDALKLKGTPVLIGVNAGRIEWAISGVLNDPSALQSVVTSWVAK